MAHFPDESAAYRAARNALLAEEIELRRHIERVAGKRRALPPGGRVPNDFEFVSESGRVQLSSLFGDKETLMIYSMMYRPARKSPCPMCTSFLAAEYKKQRGFDNLPFVSDVSGEYTRTYVNPQDEDMPGFSVFNRRDGTVRHFYSGEMSGGMADPGQDARGAPDLDPLWLMLDLTPEGRGADWYPQLVYRGEEG
jgi:predicted dithiol-disulfide oxidoreductase (DUF899 family)